MSRVLLSFCGNTLRWLPLLDGVQTLRPPSKPSLLHASTHSLHSGHTSVTAPFAILPSLSRICTPLFHFIWGMNANSRSGPVLNSNPLSDIPCAFHHHLLSRDLCSSCSSPSSSQPVITFMLRLPSSQDLTRRLTHSRCCVRSLIPPTVMELSPCSRRCFKC